MKNKRKFDYGKYIVEYRYEKGGELYFLRKKIMNTDEALKEANILRDKGYDGIMIREN